MTGESRWDLGCSARGIYPSRASWVHLPVSNDKGRRDPLYRFIALTLDVLTLLPTLPRRFLPFPGLEPCFILSCTERPASDSLVSGHDRLVFRAVVHGSESWHTDGSRHQTRRPRAVQISVGRR